MTHMAETKTTMTKHVKKKARTFFSLYNCKRKCISAGVAQPNVKVIARRELLNTQNCGANNYL